jgi:hypothetical protein
VENRLAVQGYDGQKSLGLKIERYTGVAKPITWLPTLEWNENTAKPAWKLTDRAAGGEMNADLKSRP